MACGLDHFRRQTRTLQHHALVGFLNLLSLQAYEQDLRKKKHRAAIDSIKISMRHRSESMRRPIRRASYRLRELSSKKAHTIRARSYKLGLLTL